jgi:hypothetical protein
VIRHLHDWSSSSHQFVILRACDFFGCVLWSRKVISEHEPGEQRERRTNRSPSGGAVAGAGAAADGDGGAVCGRPGVGAASGADGDGTARNPGSDAVFRAHPGARGSGGSGRYRSAVAGGVVVVRVYSGPRIGARVGAALRGERGVPLAVRRGDGESPLAVGFSRRPRRGAGRAVHASDRVAGGPGIGVGEPGEPGRSAGASERGGGEFPPGRALAEVAGGIETARGRVAAAVGESGICGGERRGSERRRKSSSDWSKRSRSCRS